MGLADRDAIDTLAATLFSRDHPERCWNALEDRERLGTASAIEIAVYRGFARARLEAERRAMPAPEVAAAALAATGSLSKPQA